MLRCLSRWWHPILLSLIVTLLFSNSVIYANEESEESPQQESSEQETPQETNPLTLDTDVEVPEAFWRNIDSESEEEVPTMAQTPAPPLEPPPVKRVTLMLDWYLSPQHAALVIAKERGLYAAQGLEVEIQSPADPSIAIKLLTAGEVDLALTRQPLLHLQVHNGAHITRIATLIETSLTAVIVTGEEQAETESTLAGLHYGYTTGEGRDLSIPRLLPRSVQQTDDFTPPVNLHFDPIRAIREGQIDAVADGFYHYLPQQLATEGINTHVIRFDELDIPRNDGLVVLANSDTLARRADTWSRFVLALEQASHWIIDNPDAAWDLLVSAHPVLDNDINANAWEDILRRMALSPAALDSRRYAGFETFLQQAGIIEDTLPVSRLAVNPHTL
ncbi:MULTISPECIES: ABC transporter substrate-binding protein [unclassified Halomonas]|uniref:ABC transporter substrate-binding protein n=1 Tax=unclassified Halomonas TaxID=2609666 RepID=UPI00054F2F9F|nr:MULTISPECIES: ABC transporter substrate-binding protein [unclassified Halomonas]CEP36053.1 ABC transporter periplasmic protein [Halomonas sp. R57-5]